MRNSIPMTLLVVAAVGLAGCNSVSSQIRALDSEERDIGAQIDALQAARKANIHLQTALQSYDRASTSMNRRALERARAEYAVARAKVE